ncbi:MAG TPA: hypothetical protein VFH51_14005, partial [Myxococcota bacterium]|nr:hypothetical protein [Myxococcota bacterium]
SGATWTGRLSVGHPTGEGVYVWPNGDRFEGPWGMESGHLTVGGRTCPARRKGFQLVYRPHLRRSTHPLPAPVAAYEPR